MYESHIRTEKINKSNFNESKRQKLDPSHLSMWNLWFLFAVGNAAIYAFDIEKADQLVCTGDKEPIPECTENSYSRYHIQQHRNLTIKLWSKLADYTLPEVLIANSSSSVKIEPVVLLTRVPFDVVVRVPELTPGLYEIRIAEFPSGVRVILDSADTVWPTKSGTAPGTDSRNHFYLFLIPVVLIVIAAVGVAVYKFGGTKIDDQRIELLEQYYDDEFETRRE
jgi:hypothetical protein